MSDFSEDAQKNPAAEADGKSMAELFATDPLELSSQEREAIIHRFQKERREFIEADRNKKGKETKSSSRKNAAQDLDISVDDIDI